MKILLVEDNEILVKGLIYSLEQKKYQVIHTLNVENTLKILKTEKIDLAILDVSLPDGNGFDLYRNNIKEKNISSIFLTAKDTENDRLTGFNLGADDYISKPFSIREVIARVKAVLRRTATDNNTNQETLSFDQLLVNIPQKKVTIKGEEITLTKKEFEILKLLLGNQGHVFSREEILSRVWSDEVYVLDRTIDVNITRLRKKIGEYGKNIVTRLGYGYCFENA